MNMYNILCPPEKLLKNIDFVETDFWGIDIIPYIEAENAWNMYSLIKVEMLQSLIIRSYQFWYGWDSEHTFEIKNKSAEFTQRSLVSVSELIKNVYQHGNKGKLGSEARLGYWHSKKGILLGIQDEGSFYSDPQTALKIKNRNKFNSSKETGGGNGIESLYRYSNFLEVIPGQNALFAGFLWELPIKAL